MYLLYGAAEVHIYEAASLKDKRRVVQSLLHRIRQRFDISIREVGHQESWQRASLGFAAICNAPAEGELIADAIRSSIESSRHSLELNGFWHEILHPDH